MYIGIIFIALTSSNIEKAFLDITKPLKGEQEIGRIGSSRIRIWDETLDKIKNEDFSRLILGNGFKINREKNSMVASTHNDFLGLFLTLGIAGLFLYISILIQIFFDILRSDIKVGLKFNYFGFLIAVIAMNALSNSYISRVEASQYFYFIVGSFYVFNKNRPKNMIKAIIK
jgi:O-antigen ligase